MCIVQHVQRLIHRFSHVTRYPHLLNSVEMSRVQPRSPIHQANYRVLTLAYCIAIASCFYFIFIVPKRFFSGLNTAVDITHVLEKFPITRLKPIDVRMGF